MLPLFRIESIGKVIDISDNIVSVSGLRGAFSGEHVWFKQKNGDITGFIWNLEEEVCKIPLISGTQTRLKIDDIVYRSHKLVNTKCGFGVLGEVMDPLGTFLIKSDKSERKKLIDSLFNISWAAVECSAPGIIQRAPVTVPFLTGMVAIDCLNPIGCGQRELIIGDHNSGKTSLAITAIINQHYRNNILCGEWNKGITWTDYKYSLFFPCIYVSVGGKRSEIVRLRKVLIKKESLNYTCIIFTSADDLAALQYLAPFAGCAVGEWFMSNGYDSVVVYDELTQHAIAYRQMALLLRRPPGREAFPGDIFYLHARLLERAAQLATGGSLTALPIVQTLGGDLSGYISTNIISITDGQIFLVQKLINEGVRPAVDLTLSVSRIGTAAQYPAMLDVSRKARGIFSMYRLFSGMSKVGSDDVEVRRHVRRGERMKVFFTQAIYETYSLYTQVLGLYALSLDAMDVILPSSTKSFFKLLSIKDIISIMPSRDTSFVTLYDKPHVLESLLMIFSFDLIKGTVTKLIKEFSAFFAQRIQHRSALEIEYIIVALGVSDKLDVPESDEEMLDSLIEDNVN